MREILVINICFLLKYFLLDKLYGHVTHVLEIIHWKCKTLFTVHENWTKKKTLAEPYIKIFFLIKRRIQITLIKLQRSCLYAYIYQMGISIEGQTRIIYNISFGDWVMASITLKTASIFHAICLWNILENRMEENPYASATTPYSMAVQNLKMKRKNLAESVKIERIYCWFSRWKFGFSIGEAIKWRIVKNLLRNCFFYGRIRGCKGRRNQRMHDKICIFYLHKWCLLHNRTRWRRKRRRLNNAWNLDSKQVRGNDHSMTAGEVASSIVGALIPCKKNQGRTSLPHGPKQEKMERKNTWANGLSLLKKNNKKWKDDEMLQWNCYL